MTTQTVGHVPQLPRDHLWKEVSEACGPTSSAFITLHCTGRSENLYSVHM